MKCRSAVIAVRGLALAYHRWAAPDRPILLLLHGFLDCGRSWQWVVDELGGEFDVIAPDMRGFGSSGWAGDGGYYHFYDYFSDILGLIDALGLGKQEPGEPALNELHIAGHSMGGSVATGVAALLGERCRSLVLLEGMGPPTNDPNQTVQRLQSWATALGRDPMTGTAARRRESRKTLPDVETAARRLQKHNPRLTQARAVELATHLTEPADGGVVFRHDPLHMTPAAKPYYIDEARAMWRAVTAPVLVLSGAESLMPTQDLAERAGNLAVSQLRSVPGAGHNIHHDRPDFVAEAIRDWAGQQLR